MRKSLLIATDNAAVLRIHLRRTMPTGANRSEAVFLNREDLAQLGKVTEAGRTNWAYAIFCRQIWSVT
jgi:hypothetical protein